MIQYSNLKMTHSTVLSKNGKPFVAVMFEMGEKKAEGNVPECKIVYNNGFAAEEIAELEAYMDQNRKEIIEAAKKISSLSYLLR